MTRPKPPVNPLGPVLLALAAVVFLGAAYLVPWYRQGRSIVCDIGVRRVQFARCYRLWSGRNNTWRPPFCQRTQAMNEFVLNGLVIRPRRSVNARVRHRGGLFHLKPSYANRSAPACVN